MDKLNERRENTEKDVLKLEKKLARLLNRLPVVQPRTSKEMHKVDLIQDQILAAKFRIQELDEVIGYNEMYNSYNEG